MTTSADPARKLDEPEFLAALKAGDEQAYETFVRTLGGRLLAVARRFLPEPSEAEDAVQEAFLQAWRKLDSFQGDSRLSTWMHRVVVNAALMKLRKKGRTKEVSAEALLPSFRDDGHMDDPSPPWVETGADVASRKERAAIVRQAIDKLPDGYRNVILLRDIEGLDTAQTAELLDISTNATKTRLHRARQALRTLLDPHLRPEAEV